MLPPKQWHGLWLLLAFAAACQTAPEDVVARAFAAVQRDALDAALANHAADAVWLPPDAARVEGRSAILAWLTAWRAQMRGELVFTPEATEATADRALVRGRLRCAAPQRADRITAILRRGDAGWRIVQLAWQTADAAR